MANYGYAWVPDGLEQEGTNEQIETFHRFGIRNDHIYEDRQADSTMERLELKKLLKRCKSNDLIFVKSLDRLGVSYEQLRENWIEITVKTGIDVCVIDSPMIDTRRGKELVSDVVLSVLTYVSKTANTGSSEIQSERMRAAALRGVKLGRPKWQPTEGFVQVYERQKSGELSQGQAAKELGIPKSTYRSQAGAYEALMETGAKQEEEKVAERS